MEVCRLEAVAELPLEKATEAYQLRREQAEGAPFPPARPLFLDRPNLLSSGSLLSSGPSRSPNFRPSKKYLLRPSPSTRALPGQSRLT